MHTTKLRVLRAILTAALIWGFAHSVCAQVPTLDKGHRIIVQNGLQIWGVSSDILNYDVNYSVLEGANMNGVMWGFPANGYNVSNGGTETHLLSPGDKWAKWTPWEYNTNPANGAIVTPQNTLTAAENARKSDLIALQVGDEINQSDMETGTRTRDWLLAAGNGTATAADDVFPDSLLYVNSFHIINHANYANFIATANPDAISWDSYPFANPHGHYILPRNWLTLANTFRRHALGSYIGATNNSPRPYGMYLQTFHDSFAVDPGEVQMRWQQFVAWTLGYKFVDAFIFSGGNNNFGNNPAGSVYLGFQETARQGENLSPALSKLISYGYGPSFVQGAGSTGIPGDWIVFDRNNAQPGQRYLTGISNVTNLGTKNGGLSGDVYVGFFNPLHLSFGDPTGTNYFMVMNGLGGDLTLPNGQSDNTATVAETRQQMTLNFDFGVTGIDSLLRLNRNTGIVEVINTSFNDGGNTVLTSLGNGKYQLQLKLDGGTGDLFKYNDGTPFVGVQAALPHGYWDGDANAGNNNVANGAGLGGNGTWDAGSARWYNGTSDNAYSANSNVVFAGTGGTVTLASPQAASSLHFKSNNYTITGSTLTLNAPTITVDAGAIAAIDSTISGTKGLIKNGGGTLKVSAANNYSGNTTINEGVLAISSANIGALPAVPTRNIQINHGATLRFNAAGIALHANRQIVLDAGGVLDTNGNNASVAGVISGQALTKSGGGTLTLTGNNSHSGTNINGGAVHVAFDGGLGAAPASFTPGNITLDGGTLRFGDNFAINNNRGITLGPNDGTIDTQQFNNGASGYNASQGGFRGEGDLTKLGTGTFFASATSTGANTLWTGRLIIKEGTWKIVGSDGLPYNVPAGDGLQPGHITLDGGTWQIGATIGVTNGRRGVTVTGNGGTIDTQSFNLTWAGPMAGSNTNAVFNKIGTGILRFTGTNSASTYNGIVNINQGTLRLDNGNTMGSLATINLADTAGATLHVTGAQTVGSLGGGGNTGGNVTIGGISATTLTTGGNNKSTTFGGVISGADSGLTKTGNGTMTLTGASTYTGVTTVAAGTLAVDGSIAAAAVVQNGAKLAGSGTVSGSTIVQSGGTLAPGNSPGTLTLGALTLASGSSLQVEIGPTSDQVIVNGAASLNGTLAVSLLEDFTPSIGQTFTVLTADARNDFFANESLPTFANLTLDVVYDSQSVLLKVVPVLPGDFNADGSVNAADYLVWRKGWAGSSESDYNDWRTNFGRSLAGSGGDMNLETFSRVPEPFAGVLVSIAVFLLSGRRELAR
jgi:autotransporter-associated beta strand protein